MRISPNLPRKMGYARRAAAAWSTDVSIGSLLFAVSASDALHPGIGVDWDANYYLMFWQLMRLNFDFSTQGPFAPLYPMMLAAFTALGASTLVGRRAGSFGFDRRCLPGVGAAGSRRRGAAGGDVVGRDLCGRGGVRLLLVSECLDRDSLCRRVHGEHGDRRCFLARLSLLWWFLPLGMLAPLRFVGVFPAALLSVLMVWRLWDGARPSAALFARLAGAPDFRRRPDCGVRGPQPKWPGAVRLAAGTRPPSASARISR